MATHSCRRRPAQFRIDASSVALTPVHIDAAWATRTRTLVGISRSARLAVTGSGSKPQYLRVGPYARRAPPRATGPDFPGQSRAPSRTPTRVTQHRHIVRITTRGDSVQRQSPEVQTIYAELLEQVAAYEASRTIGHSPGSFVTKMVKGQEYYYFQHVGPGGAKRQTDLGRRDAALDALADRFIEGRVNAWADQRSIERLAPCCVRVARWSPTRPRLGCFARSRTWGCSTPAESLLERMGSSCSGISSESAGPPLPELRMSRL